MKWFLFLGLLAMPLIGAAQVVDTAAVRVEVDSLVQVCRTLTGQRKYEEALQVIEVAKKKAVMVCEVESARYATCVFNQGKALYFMRKYSEAELSYLEAKAIQEKILGKEHSDYAITLNNLAILYNDNNQYDKAESLYLEAKAIREKVLGKEHPDYAISLNNLASLYMNKGEYGKAEPLYLEAKAIREKVLGKNHLDYAISLNNLGMLYLNKGQYDKAEPLYLEAKDVREKVLGKEHQDYARSLNNLGNLYINKGEYDKAEPLYLEAKSIREKVLGKEHSGYAESLNSLAALYSARGEYDKAEPLYLETKSIREKVLGKEHPIYAGSLSNLANLYLYRGEYDKAESLYLEAKNIREKVLGKEHLEYAKSLNSLAVLYLYIGEYNKAEHLFMEAKSIREKVLGKEHPDYASCLNNLAALFKATGEFDKSEALLLEAKVIREKALGKEHPDFALSLNSLATSCTTKGEYYKAEPLYLEAIDILGKSLGNEHPDYATCVDNLATNFKAKGEYKNAELRYLEAKTIRKNVLGKAHPDYALSLTNLALIYRDMAQPQKSEPYFTEASIIHKYILQKSATYLPSLELEKNIALYQDKNDAFFSFNHQTSSDSFRIESFNNALFYKGFALETTTRLEQAMLNASDSIPDLHSRWKGYNFLLAAELAKPIAERKHITYLDSMSTVLEKILLRSAPAFAEAQKQVEWQDVQKALQPGEAAIEFIHYRYSDKKITDSTMYSALITIPGDNAPHFIPLCEARPLDALISKPNGTRANYIQNLYAANHPDGQASLYQLIWQPIEQYLRGKGIKTVYFSPSGLLHRLNLAAIAPDQSGQTLSNRYRLVQMGSTRQLVNRTSPSSNPKSALVYGGIRYDMDSTAIFKANQDIAATAQDTTGGLFHFAFREATRSDSSQYLPGTEKEARHVYNLLQKRGISATLRLGYYGTEESIKQIGLNEPSPDLLILGTHGFFFPDPKDTTRRPALPGQDAPVFKISEHPLIRSGLKFAGSDYAWNTKHPMHGMEDGILTALEVSQLNLSHTKLVVLSACETGLGDIKGNEGVYGLQRAFRIAGVQYIMMSLWKVSDSATEKLMTRFYNNWLERKQPLRESFEEAQQWLRVQKGFENPYFWAGFVLVGGGIKTIP